MCGTMQDLTVTGQSKVSERGSSGKKMYKTTSNSSYVDEMLFGSPSDRRRSNENSFSTPKSKALPLLWSPPVYGSKSDTAGSRSSRPPSGRLSGSSSRSESRRGNMPRTKNKYRLVKHTPTFVDEQLFGSRLSEPDFAAPWEEKDRRDTPLMWSPGTPTVDKIASAPTSGRRPNSRPSSALRERPGSRALEQPLYYQSGVETRTGRYSSWSRPGSAASGRTSATGVRPRWNP